MIGAKAPVECVKTMKKRVIFLVLAVILVGIVIFTVYYVRKSRTPFSYIEEPMSEYIWSGKLDTDSIESIFSVDSAEAFFIKGMKCYVNNEQEQAEQYFKEAEKRPYTDAALPMYLNVYLNECETARTGVGNVEYVKKALNQITGYTPVRHRDYLVWHLTYSVIDAKDSDVSAQELLGQYIKNAKGLKEDELLLLNTYQAVLKNVNGEYSESIIMFCDIMNKAKDMKESSYVTRAKYFCMDYLADMYYSCGAYDEANRLYRKQLSQTINDPHENADMKYSAYINSCKIYLKQKDYRQAQKMIDESETILPYLSKEIAREVQACMYNLSANMALDQGNLEEAEALFANCTELMKDHENAAFFDTRITFELTHCKILKEKGDYKQAELLLNDALNDATLETPIKYDLIELLSEIYRMTDQDENYLQEQELLLKEQNDRIKEYQSGYFELINYYGQLLSLRKEHDSSVSRNKKLIAALFVVLLMLGAIIKLSIEKYQESLTDALSGLYNRKKLDKELVFFKKNSERILPYGIIMIDIDFFKKYNDTYGHVAGDRVIRQVSAIMSHSVRTEDIVIRYGGEEILVLLKNVNRATVESIAERIRMNVEGTHIPHKASECSDCVTLSVGGLFISEPSVISLSDAIKKVDKALYNSKQNGRNMVTVF